MTKITDVQSLFKRAGNNLPSIDRIAGQMLRMRYPLGPALQAYKEYLVFRPDSANAAFNYAYYLARDGQFELSVQLYLRALKLGIDQPEEVHLNIANIYMDHLRDRDKARQHLQRALTINPAYSGAYHNLGNLSEQDGDRDEATRCFEKCLTLDPANETALARLADAHRFSTDNDPLLTRLIEKARTSDNSDLHFALGRAYEQIAFYEKAWEHFSIANKSDWPTLPVYREDATEAIFRQIISQCDERWLARFEGVSEEFVFICGMFRTGSTLLEQVLGAHPRFLAGGEREFFPRLVAREVRNFPEGLGGINKVKARSWQKLHLRQTKQIYGHSARVTDKRPDNFLHIGLIKAILPSAKFIVTERDWRDVAASIYSVRLGHTQNYATSLKEIRHYIGLQKELIDHWQSLLGPDLIRIRYEDLVTEPRCTITGLLKDLGEDWDERCLEFNKLKNSVQTASVWQVREPFHTRSVGRWQNYRRFFEDAFGTGINA